MGNKRRKAKSKLPRALPSAGNLVVKRSEKENESERQVFLSPTHTRFRTTGPGPKRNSFSVGKRLKI